MAPVGALPPGQPSSLVARCDFGVWCPRRGEDADRHSVRQRHSLLVRRYHPDKNGGDRSHEVRLGAVIEAYQLLRKARAFA